MVASEARHPEGMSEGTEQVAARHGRVEVPGDLRIGGGARAGGGDESADAGHQRHVTLQPRMSPRYRKHPQTAGRVVDGLAFVVTADDQKLHTLNSTATRLWELAASGTSADEAAEVLVSVYQVEPSTALADARECLEDLVSRQILIRESE